MTTGIAAPMGVGREFGAWRTLLTDALLAGGAAVTSALGRLTEAAFDMVGCGAVAMINRNLDGSLTRFAPRGVTLPASSVKHDVHAARVIAGAAGLLTGGTSAEGGEPGRGDATVERRNRWLTGSTELTRELVSGVHDDPMQVLVERVLDVADADLVAVVMPSADGQSVVVTSAAGHQAHLIRHEVFERAATFTDHVMTHAEPVTLDGYPDAHRYRDLVDSLGVGPAVHVPMVDSRNATTQDERRTGALTLFRNLGRPSFNADEVDMAATFAAQMVLALELAEARADRERAALLAERDRIARDLHDHVIQQLFALGMTIQSTVSRVDAASGARLQGAIDDLDSTILQIRSTIFRLNGPVLGSGATLRSRAESLIGEIGLIAPFSIGFEVSGPVDFGVADTISDDVLAVLREALTNAAKHSGAEHAYVTIDVEADRLSVCVGDNGRGIDGATRRSGLANMRARAAQHGGALEIDSSSAGTTLRWSVPLG